MNKETNNSTYLYLIIPYDYICIYNKLLKLLSNLGLEMLYDCGTSCKSSSKNLITCWNMFQTACASYSIGDIKKADTIIKYINSQLDLGCENITRQDIKIIYYGDSNIIPDELYIVSGANIDCIKYPSFKVPFFKLYNYIAVPQGVVISSIIGANNGGDVLYDESTDIDKYDRCKTIINGDVYLLWLCNFEQPLNYDVIVNTRVGVWELKNTIYFGSVDKMLDIYDIVRGSYWDINDTKTFTIDVNNIINYIVVPDGYTIDTIENANFKGDWLYNAKMDIDLYEKEYVIIDNYKYSLWHYKTALPLNGVIEVKLK